MPAAAPTTTALDTERLTATTLEDLNASAGLLTRIDRKYLVASDTAQGVIDALAERALVLDIDGLRCFSYASTYFDTPELGSYFQAAHKRRRRFKIRTRSYLDSGLTFLEVKTRGPRGATIKQRMDYRAADADHLTPEGLGFIADCLAPLSGSVRDARRVARSLKPVMSTTYRRTTLHLPDDGARATIDTDLTWTAFASGEDDEGEERGSGTRATRRGAPRPAGPLAVVETKNPARCSPTDRYLWANGHRPSRISKYATGMAVLHPELPANKWHRLLTRELGSTGSTARAA